MDTDQKILERFIQNHTDEVLNIIDKIDEERLADFLQLLPVEKSILLLSQMERHKAARSLEKIGQEQSIELIGNLPESVAVLILRQMDHEVLNSFLKGLPAEHSKSLRQILSYPKDTVGAYLDPKVLTLQENLNIGQGLEKIKANRPNVPPHLFILSRDHLLVGYIELKDLIINKRKKPIRDVMNPDPPKILADINIKIFTENNGWIDPFFILPVVDAKGIFLGVISKDSLSDIHPIKTTYDRQAQQASMALGDLYRIGFSSFFRSASEIIWENKNE